jgi:hypothetical protein
MQATPSPKKRKCVDYFFETQNARRVQFKKATDVKMDVKMELDKLHCAQAELKDVKLELSKVQCELKHLGTIQCAQAELKDVKLELQKAHLKIVKQQEKLEELQSNTEAKSATPRILYPYTPAVKDQPSFQSTFTATDMVQELSQYCHNNDLLALARINHKTQSIFVPRIVKQKQWKLSQVQEWPSSRLVHINRLLYDNAFWVGLPAGLQGIKNMKLDEEFRQQLEVGMLPDGLRSLFVCVTKQNACHFSASAYPIGLTELTINLVSAPDLWNFKQNLGKLALPEGLAKISLINTETWGEDETNDGLLVDHPVAFTLPARLKTVVFSGNFDQSWMLKVLPTSLTNLDLDGNFNQALVPGSLPVGLSTLRIDEGFNKLLVPGVLTEGLVSVELGKYFDQPLAPRVFPESLKDLELWGFNHSLEADVLPTGLRRLKFWFFNSPLVAGVLSPSLEILELGIEFDKPIGVGVLPKGLKSLKLGPDFNQALQPGVLPASLQYLQIGHRFDHPLASVLPAGLTELTCSIGFKHIPVVLPGGRRLCNIRCIPKRYEAGQYCLSYC